MNKKQWDKDIENGIENLRIADEEIKQHMGNLFSLSGGKIGMEYNPDIKTNLMSGK